MNIEDDILIERFLRNELSEEEKNQFLKRVHNDEVFKKQYVFEKQLSESLNEDDWSYANNFESKEVEEYAELFKEKEIQQLKEVIQKANAEYKVRKKGRIIKLISAIASVGLIFIMLNVFLKSAVDTSKLYLENIQLIELPSFATRGNEITGLDLAKAESLFKEKRYKESLVVFDKVFISENDNSSVFIYKAIAHTELNQYREGELVLNELINSDLIDAEKGYWYKSLLFVKSNQLKKAKATLNIIVNNSYYNTNKAKELLEQL